MRVGNCVLIISKVLVMSTLCLMQIVDRSHILKKWYGKCVAHSVKLNELFSTFSSGELDNGLCIPEKYNGCKVCIVFCFVSRGEDSLGIATHAIFVEIIGFLAKVFD